MPKIVKVSLWMFLASIAAGPIIGFLNPTPVPSLPPDSGPTLTLAVLLFFVPFFGVIAFIAYCTYRGRNWARWVFAAFTAFGAWAYLKTLSADLSVHLLIGVLEAAVLLVQVGAVALLFAPASNQWYRAPASASGAT
jgi:hypothetical protein